MSHDLKWQVSLTYWITSTKNKRIQNNVNYREPLEAVNNPHRLMCGGRLTALDHFSPLRSNLYIHTLAWVVGILVSSRNWNIPRITWSIIPIVQESKGHAKNIFWTNPKKKNGKRRWLVLPSPSFASVRLKMQKSRFHSPVSLPWKGSQGGIVSVVTITLVCCISH